MATAESGGSAGKRGRLFLHRDEAVNIARKYSVPVIILSDQAIATRIEAFQEPNLEKSARTFRPTSHPCSTTNHTILNPVDGLSRHIAPGTRVMSGKYPVVPAWSMMNWGIRLVRRSFHMQMVAKRRKKLQALSAFIAHPRRSTDRRKETSCWSAGDPPRVRSGSG